MQTYRIAHIHEQGQDIIIIPLEEAFERRTPEQQQAEIVRLQEATIAANLKGRVVPVWNDPFGRMRFIAPTNWRPFFVDMNMAVVAQKLNKELTVY